MSRKITIFFQQTGEREVIETDAKTFDELEDQITGSTSGKKLVIKEDRLTIESGSSVLPQKDMTIFVYPMESKAGEHVYYYTQKQIKAMIPSNLRRSIRRLNAKGITNIPELAETPRQRQLLMDYFKGVKQPSKAKESVALKPISKKKSTTQKKNPAKSSDVVSRKFVATADNFDRIEPDVQVKILDGLDAINEKLDRLVQIAETVGSVGIAEQLEIELLRKEADDVARELGLSFQ